MVDPATAIASGLFAGVVAVGVTLAIERWGGRLGGLVGTLPSTIVPAAMGIAAEATDHQAFRAAMFATPVGMLVNVGFLWLWRALPTRLPMHWGRLRLATMVTLSLVGWTLAALGSVTWLGRIRDQELTL
ncbi:MAG: hypothetical protein QGG40_06660, partial [Myxococcota bacterium]|nr:hypothetical protein [Myxococcota bacterium]